MDVFFALSHGVHRGILKSGKFDDRAIFVKKLIDRTKNVKFDIYGIDKDNLSGLTIILKQFQILKWG